MARYSLRRRYLKIQQWVRLWYFRKVKKSLYTNDIIQCKYLQVGRHTYGSPEILIFPGDSASVNIGSFCSIALGVKIFTGGNHKINWVSTYPFNQFSEAFPSASNITGHPFSKGNVIIGNDVWIGQDVTILSGVTIGDGAVIGAGSVVTKNVEPYEIVAGNPARSIRKRFGDNVIEKMLKIKWWDWDIRKIENEVTALCSENIESFINKHYSSE